MLLKEHRYMFLVGATDHVFRVEELVKGTAGWPGRFRLKLAASSLWEAQTFYGESCRDVAEKAFAGPEPALLETHRSYPPDIGP